MQEVTPSCPLQICIGKSYICCDSPAINTSGQSDMKASGIGVDSLTVVGWCVSVKIKCWEREVNERTAGGKWRRIRRVKQSERVGCRYRRINGHAFGEQFSHVTPVWMIFLGHDAQYTFHFGAVDCVAFGVFGNLVKLLKIFLGFEPVG